MRASLAVIGLAFAVASTAAADPAPVRWTDAQFIQAHVCREAAKTAKAEGLKSITAAIASQRLGRSDYTREQATEAARKAARDSRRAATEAEKAEVEARIRAACASVALPSPV